MILACESVTLSKQFALQLDYTQSAKRLAYLPRQQGILQKTAFGLHLHYQLSWVSILLAFGLELCLQVLTADLDSPASIILFTNSF